MTFNIRFPTENIKLAELSINPGEIVFLVGTNGAGKSGLMQILAKRHKNQCVRVPAHRQNWMNSSAANVTAASRMKNVEHFKAEEQNSASRFKDTLGQVRTDIAIFDLIESENKIGRDVIAHHKAGDHAAAQSKATEDGSPIDVLNRLLLHSNISLELSINENNEIMASKDDGPKYSANQISDGERNALFLAANVLTAETGTLLLIDEPERHLHRSIIVPLLTQLIDERDDCAFVISTHEHDLPPNLPNSETILLRSCSYDTGGNPSSWEADKLSRGSEIDEALRRDLLGARRKILFVEGNEDTSIDKPLYSIIFPGISVVPRGSCHEVERAVDGLHDNLELHWVAAYGLVDGDGCTPEQIEAKSSRGIYSLPYYSAEAVYYHPIVIDAVAAKSAELNDEDGLALAQDAKKRALESLQGHTDRLSEKVAGKRALQSIISQIPNVTQLISGATVTIQNSGAQIKKDVKSALDTAISASDWEAVLRSCPIKNSGASDAVRQGLKMSSTKAYEKAVRKILSEDSDLLSQVRDFFGNLYNEIENT